MDLSLEALVDPDLIRARQQVFAALRPACAALLQLRRDARGLAAALAELRVLVEQQDARGLLLCWDYITFPLLLMLEQAVALRQPQHGGSSDDAAPASQSTVPAAESDAVAEALLAVVLALQRRARCRTEDQLLPLVQRLAAVVALPRDAASEEMRLLAFQGLAAALQPSAGPPASGSGAGARTPAEACDAAGGEPRLHLLAGESLAPLAGALIYGCLAGAEQEVAAGGVGSKAVRAAALAALHAAAAAVGSADGLAFFLPGIASGLHKQLLASGGVWPHGAGCVWRVGGHAMWTAAAPSAQTRPAASGPSGAQAIGPHAACPPLPSGN